MPGYELNFIVKRIPRAALVECLKRVGEGIIDGPGSVLRKIEFLGHRKLPYRLGNPHQKGSARLKEGSYFIYHFDTAPETSKKIIEDLKLDYDIIHTKLIHRLDKIPDDYVCTLHEELLPPAHRPSVTALIGEGRRRTPLDNNDTTNFRTHVDDGDPHIKYWDPTNKWGSWSVSHRSYLEVDGQRVS